MKEFIAHCKELELIFILIAMGNHWRVLCSKTLLNCMQITLIIKREMIAREWEWKETSMVYGPMKHIKLSIMTTQIFATEFNMGMK